MNLHLKLRYHICICQALECLHAICVFYCKRYEEWFVTASYFRCISTNWRYAAKRNSFYKFDWFPSLPQIILNLYYKGWCVFVCGHWNVQTLTSPPVLKLWDSQGYLWLSYDLMEVINLIGVTFKQKNTLCHSFRIIVIPSVLLSFLPYYCHSFQIIVIPSGFLSFLPF